MSAYLATYISGNESFGGYLSVDGQSAFAIREDMTYELMPGKHQFIIYTTSNAERAAGKFQQVANNAAPSSGKILDSIYEAQAKKSMGDSWEFVVEIQENQMLQICTYTEGMKFTDEPAYKVEELSEEAVEALEAQFEEYRNTPRRNKKQMIWGAIIAFLGIFGTYNFITTSTPEDEISSVFVLLGLAAIGLIVFFLGFQKKIRK